MKTHEIVCCMRKQERRNVYTVSLAAMAENGERCAEETLRFVRQNGSQRND